MTAPLLLLDTNIVSYLMRADPLAGHYAKILVHQPQSLSFMTVAELHEGALRANWSDRRMMFLQQEIDRYILYPSTEETCHIWARIRHGRQLRPISAQDAWIAATALEHSCPLVTHNASDFEGIVGLKILTAG